MYLARPRDDEGKPNKRRPVREGTLADPWVVECFNDRGAWSWTHYGETPMIKRQAKQMVKDLSSKLAK